MDYLNDLLPMAMLCAAWLQTPDGTNLMFAAICGAALVGLPAHIILSLTMLVHLALILL